MTVKWERELKKKLKGAGIPFELTPTRRHMELSIDGVVVLHLSRSNKVPDYGSLDTIIRQRQLGKPLHGYAVRQAHEESHQ